MCGICGIYSPGVSIEPDVIRKMTDILSHRGPDGQGIWISGGIALGHRRLSIIDVAGGQQPMSNDDDSIHLTFNGEIYNYIELRRDLIHRGFKFKSSSDTEVLLRAYECWGIDCIQHLDGMFAFALWDDKLKRLFLARDHLGIKPLYFHFHEFAGNLIFASEIKSLLQFPACPRAVDTESLALLFAFRAVPSPDTLFSGVRKLPPGHRLIVDENGISMERYWHWRPVIRRQWRESDLVQEYQYLLTQTIRRQLRSDVPVGLFLSSGVDSAGLLALMSEQSRYPVKTYTLGFLGGEKTSEIVDAKLISDHFGAEHHHHIIDDGDYMAYFDRYMQDIEEPVADEPAPAFYFLAELAAQDVKVVLSGQGADEPWAGYDRYIGVKLSTWYSRLPTALTGLLANAVEYLPLPLERVKRGLVSLAEPDLIERFMKIYSFFSEDLKQALFCGILRQQYCIQAGKRVIQRHQASVQNLDPLSQMLYLDTRLSLPDDLLMVADKTSMAHSLEVRVPFLDYRLVEFVESLPPQLKLKCLTGKYLHKKALSHWLPATVISRPKSGFAHPMNRWLKTRFSPLIHELVLAEDSPLSPYLDHQQLNVMYARYKARKEPYMRHFFLLLTLALWLRHYQL